MNVGPFSVARVKRGRDISLSWTYSKTDTTREIVELWKCGRLIVLTFRETRTSSDRVVCRKSCRTNLSQIRSIRAAQTLNSGILLVGSSAAFVRLFADCPPPQ